MNPLLIPVLEQRLHIGGFKIFSVLDGEIGFDIGEVVIHPIVLRDRVYTEDVAVAAVMDHRRNRPAHDRQQAPIHRGPIGVEPAAADDISVPLTGQGALSQVDEPTDLRRIQKSLRYRPAVHMHFLVMPALRLDIDQHRWKQPWE